MVWAGRSNCDLPESLPFPGTVMLQGSCRASMSVAGPLPAQCVSTAEAAVSGAVGVGRPSWEASGRREQPRW